MENADYALSFSVPEPLSRPGEEPDFSGMDIPAAGSARRPDVDCSPRNMKDMARDMVRVLDRDSIAVGPWVEPDLDPEVLLHGLRSMLRMRAFDQRMLSMQRQGKTSFYIQCTGEEAIAIAHQSALSKGDMSFPTYRQQGLLMAQNYPLDKMICQIFSNEKDPLEGRQMPILHSAKDYGFFTLSGNLGTQFIHAVGWAMASAIKGDSKIASAWIGEGAAAEIDFHSALVNASVYKPPVILNVVNNQWAISSFYGIAGGDHATFAERAHGYDIPSLRVDGNDFLAVRAVSNWAVERARRNLGPTLIEWVTYRAGAHSTSDDPSKYRPKHESDAWPLGDPVLRLAAHLTGIGVWSDQRQVQAEAEFGEEVRKATKRAEAYGVMGQGVRVGAMFENVYKTMPAHLIAQQNELEE
jgi:2-oxoisovalerate dehydrogenase E1 component alpha subunit